MRANSNTVAKDTTRCCNHAILPDGTWGYLCLHKLCKTVLKDSPQSYSQSSHQIQSNKLSINISGQALSVFHQCSPWFWCLGTATSRQSDNRLFPTTSGRRPDDANNTTIGSLCGHLFATQYMLNFALRDERCLSLQ